MQLGWGRSKCLSESWAMIVFSLHVIMAHLGVAHPCPLQMHVLFLENWSLTIYQQCPKVTASRDRKIEYPKDVCSHAFATLRGHSGKAAIFKPRKELSPEPHHAGTLILDV